MVLKYTHTYKDIQIIVYIIRHFRHIVPRCERSKVNCLIRVNEVVDCEMSAIWPDIFTTTFLAHPNLLQSGKRG